MKKILILFWFLVTGATTASSQLYRYLGTEDGLSNKRVTSIQKDNKGYMWFLTQEGVDRYNGKQYVHYKLSHEDITIQQFSNLSHLHIDNDGGIWVLGKNGYIFRYNPNLDQYELILNFTDSLQADLKRPLTHVRMDRKDQLWLCTRNAQYLYYPKAKNLVQLESPIQEEITYIEQGKGKQYFIGTNRNIYLSHLDDDDLRIETDPLLENFHIIQHLYYHEETQSLLIGTMMDGFYLYDIENRTLGNLGGMKDITINSVIPSLHSKDEELIATESYGVYLLNFKTQSLKPFISSNLHYSNKMNGDIVKDIYQDEEGRIWMAIFPIGITIYSEKYPEYEWLKNTQEGPNAFINNQITYVLEDSDGDIWVATTNGVCMFNTQTRKWKSMLSSFQQDKHDQNYVYISLCEAEPGVILVGGYMSGMYLIDKKDFVPRYFSPQSLDHNDVRPDKYIRSIYRDAEGDVWAGGYYNFKRLNLNRKEMDHYPIDYPITFITAKNKDELWVGTVNGLYQFNKRLKKFLTVNLSPEISTINTIYQANDTTTYIGTSGSGLWLYDNQTEQLENFRKDNSALISNNIHCILPSNVEGELIISTDNELTCFNVSERIFTNWTKEQGLLSGNFNTASGIKTQKDVIIFGTDDGLIIIKDTINLPRTFNSKLTFNNFSIQYQTTRPGMKGSPLTTSIDETKAITLSSDQNIFALEVNSINYDCSSRILYSWKMEGFYDQWSTPSTLNQIRYTGLPAGEYTLKIRAILLDDNRILEERDLQIIIEPSFWHTPAAYLIYMIILSGAVFGIMRFLWVRKENLISKEKILFFVHTAHDIRTPLTLIKGPLSEISRTETLSERGKHNLLTAIQSTDRLTELTTKLIHFQREEMYSSHIDVDRYELNQYIQGIIKEFKDYAENKKLLLEYEGTQVPLEVWMDTNKIESIIQNLITNALKYTPEKGKITIKLEQSTKDWILTISDTGIGISESDQQLIFRRLFRGENAINQHITGTGIGLLQTYRLVKRHRGQITVSSKENIGTTFIVRFPIDHKSYIKRETSKPSTNTQWMTNLPTINTINKPVLPAAPNTAHTILIVEDNPELRTFLSQSLCETYQIIEAENGKEALELLKQKQPHLIISDIMMPVLRGDELCKILKEDIETSHIPIILLTALGDRESIIRGLEINADSYVVKPFDLEILKANIASILSNKEILRQRFAQLNYQTEDLPSSIQKIPGLDLDQVFLKKTTAFIEKNLENSFNIDDICMEMGMSRSSFYNKIKALTDKSPSEFVRQIRMKEAIRLLEEHQHTVSEVSDLLGFSDPKYFTDTFKKYYGTTPSAYMKKEKK